MKNLHKYVLCVVCVICFQVSVKAQCISASVSSTSCTSTGCICFNVQVQNPNGVQICKLEFDGVGNKGGLPDGGLEWCGNCTPPSGWGVCTPTVINAHPAQYSFCNAGWTGSSVTFQICFDIATEMNGLGVKAYDCNGHLLCSVAATGVPYP